MKKIISFSISAILIGLSIITGSANCETIITIGRATDNVDNEHKRLDPIVKYLATVLKDQGIDKGEVILDGLNNDEAIIRLIKEKKLDIIMESPFSAALYHHRTGAYPILLVSREGVIEYNSYIFARMDSSINSLEDLKNKIIAFEDATSTSSYHLPRIALEEFGHKMQLVGSASQKFQNDHLGYIFAGSELNVSSWVFFNKVDAGAPSSKDWLDPEECPPAFRKNFKIIYKTKKIPRMMVLIRKGLRKDLVVRIKKEMMKMHESEAGRKAMEYYRLDKFVDSPDTTIQLLGSIQKRLILNQ